MVGLNISLSIPDVVKKPIINVARAGKINQSGEAYPVLLKVEQAIFCQALQQLDQPGLICLTIIRFDDRSQVCYGSSLVGGQPAQVIDDAPAKIATGAR